MERKRPDTRLYNENGKALCHWVGCSKSTGLRGVNELLLCRRHRAQYHRVGCPDALRKTSTCHVGFPGPLDMIWMGKRLCYWVGCREDEGLGYKYRAWFCPKHITEMANLQRLITHQTPPTRDEMYARQIIAQKRKDTDSGHIAYVGGWEGVYAVTGWGVSMSTRLSDDDNNDDE